MYSLKLIAKSYLADKIAALQGPVRNTREMKLLLFFGGKVVMRWAIVWRKRWRSTCFLFTTTASSKRSYSAWTSSETLGGLFGRYPILCVRFENLTSLLLSPFFAKPHCCSLSENY